MSDDLDALRQRVQELEHIALEYTRLRELIDYAAAGNDLARYMSLSVFYVDPASRVVVDANDALVELLGYPRSHLFTMTHEQLEIAAEKSNLPRRADDTNEIEAEVYSAMYRHASGQGIPVLVQKRLVEREDRRLMYYRLADESLRRRAWHELQRREDDGFEFQSKLTTLNELTIELSRIESFDGLCFQLVKYGVERLEFDRIGLWLVDAERGVMRGTYGTDEAGQVRAEHDQQWFYAGTQVAAFITGASHATMIFNNSPIYNDKSDIIGYGWQMTVPLLRGDRCLGTLAVDNYRRQQPIKRYEPELLRLYGITVAHLLELSRSRDQALALRVADERARMLREFITNIGHDFRTPLAVIRTMAYLLGRVADPDRRQSLVASIHEQVMHISRIVDGSLDFIAVQSGGALKLERVAIAGLLRDVAEAQAAASAAKNIRIELSLDDNATVTADAEYLRRALSEIVENAIQHTLAGGGVQITCEAYPNEIGIRVQDSGSGMDEEVAARVFEPLYRGDAARSTRQSGLGLTLTKAIIDAHGGRITVESTPGQGSTFAVMLPA